MIINKSMRFHLELLPTSRWFVATRRVCEPKRLHEQRGFHPIHQSIVIVNVIFVNVNEYFEYCFNRIYIFSKKKWSLTCWPKASLAASSSAASTSNSSREIISCHWKRWRIGFYIRKWIQPREWKLFKWKLWSIKLHWSKTNSHFYREQRLCNLFEMHREAFASKENTKL